MHVHAQLAIQKSSKQLHYYKASQLAICSYI